MRKFILIIALAALAAACGTTQTGAPEPAPRDDARAGAPARKDAAPSTQELMDAHREALARQEAGQRESESRPAPAPVPASAPAPAYQPAVPMAMQKSAVAGSAVGDMAHYAPTEPNDRESYGHFDDNPIKVAAEQPVSTFSVDVDTASYANVRRMLREGRLPPRDAVRVEEMVNYFGYDYPAPRDASAPFSVTVEMAPTPWNRDTRLMLVGIRADELSRAALPPANLVFLVDVSGSMQPANKLPLLKSALRLLVERLRAEDTVSLVVYAGRTEVVLEPTSGGDKARILAALERLESGGSTNGGAGIRLAYAMAEQAFRKDGINRVILATDGDFNVGTTSFEALTDLVAEKRKGGVSLTTLGFGTGNYNDRLMEKIADVGNGNHHYVDTLAEARKVLAEEMSSTLHTVAQDVKIQVEFNPALVAEYRLIGYENRVLRREDFSNDQVDAGEVGAGHTVTALYEITPVGSPALRNEPLRYGQAATAAVRGAEAAFLRLRWKKPGEEKSRLIERPIALADAAPRLEQASERLRFAASVAAFGQLLRGGTQTGGFGYRDAVELARGARGQDPHGYRGEFLGLVELAESLATRERVSRR